VPFEVLMLSTISRNTTVSYCRGGFSEQAKAKAAALPVMRVRLGSISNALHDLTVDDKQCYWRGNHAQQLGDSPLTNHVGFEVGSYSNFLAKVTAEAKYRYSGCISGKHKRNLGGNGGGFLGIKSSTATPTFDAALRRGCAKFVVILPVAM